MVARSEIRRHSMAELQPSETDLVGRWVSANGKVSGDETTQRIQHLITDRLKRVAATSGGWDVLYQDPRDGRYWELTYPDSGMHGGGPPRLAWLSSEQARQKYGDTIDTIRS
jgi:hypothetical protein